MRDKTDIIGWSVVVLLLAVALAFGWVSLVAGLALFLLALIALYLL